MKALSVASVSLALGFFLGLDGCLKEVFTPDPSDPRLPAYTEKGNEIGGALINNVAWKSDYFFGFDNPSTYPCHLLNFASKDSAVVEFIGQCNEGANKGFPISFFICISNFQIPFIKDIANLSGKTIFLDGHKNKATIRDYGKSINTKKGYFTGGTGELTIKTVKPIEGWTLTNSDGISYHPVIMAGTFKFYFASDTVSVDSGRFDFEIDGSDCATFK